MLNEKYRSRIIAVIFAGTMFIANSVMAELLIDPTAKSKKGEKQVSAHFVDTTIEYETSEIKDIERTITAASVAYGMTDGIDVYGSFGLISKAKREPYDGGDGTLYALGLRGILPVKTFVKLHGYLQYMKIDEDYGKFTSNTTGVNKRSGEETVISMGIMATAKLDSSKIYGGIETIIKNEADYEITRTNGNKGTFEGERVENVGFRVGAVLGGGDMDLHLAIAKRHESGFMIGASMNF